MLIKNPDIWIFVLLISQLLYIESLKFLYLPHIIRGVLCGVDTGILKIRCKEAEIWAKQKFKYQVYLSTPFSLFESSFLKIRWFWRFGIKMKKTGTTPGVKGFFFIFLFSLGKTRGGGKGKWSPPTKTFGMPRTSLPSVCFGRVNLRGAEVSDPPPRKL